MTNEAASQKRVYSDDRLSLAQEIAEGLKVRGFWVPREWSGPDLIMAIFKALEDQKKTILECRDALLNANACFCTPHAMLIFGKAWDEDRKNTRREILDLLAKLPEFEVDQVCEHDWKDARNNVVVSGELCIKCFAIRAGNQETK